MFRLRPGWPLTVAFLGFPLWWALGLGALIFMVMAVPMAALLWSRRRSLVVPGGFGAWLLFMVWVLLGAVVLWADAPGAIPGDGGFSRLLVYTWRLGWYVTFTIVLLYICNLTEKEMPTGKIGRLLGFMFIVTALGGLIGWLFPRLQLTSPVEMLLPQKLATNPFVRDIIHPKTAEISTILGFEESRPMAPFVYANTWGAAYAFFLPYFVLTWIVRARGRRRIAGLVILALSFWPAIYSLNRGLWAAVGLIAVFGVIKLAQFGGPKVLAWTVAGFVAASLVILASPLTDVVQDRLDNPHSNNRRAMLAEQTTRSALTGSPVVGFGSTRDVQGNLASVAGGALPGCPACGAPPLGTQGHIWLLIFANGIVGTLAFCGFFLLRFLRHARERTAYSLAGCSALLALALFVFVYDIVEVPLYTVMIAVALMWRAKRDVDVARVASDRTTEIKGAAG